MRYQISGKQIDIGEALQTHVKTELGEILEKYAGRPTEASVTFSKSGHEYVSEAVVHLSTGLTVQAKGHEHEIYAAFDSATEKMDKQLRRYKRSPRWSQKSRQFRSVKRSCKWNFRTLLWLCSGTKSIVE